MKKKIWMLFVAVICGMSSFVTANDCVACETTTTETVTQEEKKVNTTEGSDVVVADAPVADAEVVASN